jgi:hypothetical protein
LIDLFGLFEKLWGCGVVLPIFTELFSYDFYLQ